MDADPSDGMIKQQMEAYHAEEEMFREQEEEEELHEQNQ